MSILACLTKIAIIPSSFTFVGCQLALPVHACPAPPSLSIHHYVHIPTVLLSYSQNDSEGTHHWREGNLRSNTKCGLCKKPCASSECLTGFRCLWCGTTVSWGRQMHSLNKARITRLAEFIDVHASCSKKLSPKCGFGPLRHIMLPPWAVSLPRPDIPSEYTVGVIRRPQGACACHYASRMPSSA
ncbi:unnamed protein product [Dibothriocephalus latus]|uniref:Phorbol-ester/DAG-type domain-containing protein n=1 Tax=Dibothriocephalus latus TaxID=60516 RepID=A0A3P7NPV5_DIBLA|nr:unnamed protein product [Dibothriocephalus latus]